jgi:hypothetical protein
MPGFPLVSRGVQGFGATLEEADSSLDVACLDYLRGRGMLPPDFSVSGRSTQPAHVTTLTPAPAPLPADLERQLVRLRWAVDSWRSDLRLWTSHWQTKSRDITKFIVSDYPRTGSWDLVESELKLTGPMIGGYMSSHSHALNRLFPGQRRETLIERDYLRRRYVIHPLVVEALREALGVVTPRVETEE